MPKTIRKVMYLPKLQGKKRVAAYARVSTGKDAMLHSLSAQVSHYSTRIQNNPNWQYVGVYSDEAITGTKENRPGLQKLIADCRDGKIDLIITKSISRFARNTVTLLETVRMLKELGVDIYFEEQNIYTMSADGELMLTILASYAQEESLSASENQKWRVKRNFENGIPWSTFIYGYRLKNGKLEIHSEEAEVVRKIYRYYLEGLGFNAIAERLNAEGVPSSFGRRWQESVPKGILSNEVYIGNLLLQKKYRENHITKKTMVNRGQLPQYYVEEAHEAIIDLETYKAVQEERQRRVAKFNKKPYTPTFYPFTSLLVCEHCGKHYRRKCTTTGPVWICTTYNQHGKAACPSKQIPEPTLEALTTEVTGIEELTLESLRQQLHSILVCDENLLVFRLHDGTEVRRMWKDRSRAESWTEDMKAAARKKTLARRNDNG